ncbi:hypothetical protein [Paenibacillus flagellatus]|uniref:DUF6199 domain-containing protein n=1 Tax=Paenibacillus flagellatus TaxID=2211139 RepID=A0A2V5KJR0_9BACL|nr:hypothetical protein [Paenibacillus flagellatus]PYI50697.1 hypothetical protein DLM86_28420 [Paenibacillus flagellatus]
MSWIHLIPIALIAVGLLNVLFPRTGLFWSLGAKSGQAEPGEAAVLLSRIGGVLAAAIGLFLLLYTM